MIELKDFPDRKTLESFRERFDELDIPALESWLEILKTAGRLEELLNRFLFEQGLQQSRFFTLILLFRNLSGLTLSALAKGIGVSNPTMTGLIKRMERDGLVKRTPSPESRRESIIHLTDSGERLLAETLPGHYERVSQIMNGLTNEDHKKLKKILLKIPHSKEEGEV